MPPAPAAARGVFDAGRLPSIQRYAELLATEGVLRGLIGPRETPRLWDRHLVNCGLLLPLLPPGATVADLGSGAGLPGLVLALARPDLQVTLVEPLLRRTSFLEEAVQDLAATNVEVVRARAEELHGTRVFDVVTSRALAPLPRLLGWSMPLVSPRGSLLALKGAGAATEIEAAGVDLAAWRSQAEVVTLTAPDGLSTALVVRVAWDVGAPVGWQPSRSSSGSRARTGRTTGPRGGRSGHSPDRGRDGAAGRARRKDSS